MINKTKHKIRNAKIMWLIHSFNNSTAKKILKLQVNLIRYYKKRYSSYFIEKPQSLQQVDNKHSKKMKANSKISSTNLRIS